MIEKSANNHRAINGKEYVQNRLKDDRNNTAEHEEKKETSSMDYTFEILSNKPSSRLRFFEDTRDSNRKENYRRWRVEEEGEDEEEEKAERKGRERGGERGGGDHQLQHTSHCVNSFLSHYLAVGCNCPN